MKPFVATAFICLALLSTLAGCNRERSVRWGAIQKDATTFEAACLESVSVVDEKPVDRKFCTDKKFSALRNQFEGNFFKCKPLMNWEWKDCDPNPEKTMREEGEALRRSGVIP